MRLHEMLGIVLPPGADDIPDTYDKRVLDPANPDGWVTRRGIVQPDPLGPYDLWNRWVYNSAFASSVNPYSWYYSGLLEETEPKPLPKAAQTEVITGWRVWYAISLGRVTVLRSAYKETCWPLGEALKATAVSERGYDGIHAFKTREAAMQSEYVRQLDMSPLFGTVALWGRVIEHEKGYRSEYAYPQKLYVPRGVANNVKLAKAVANAYGCEVEVQRLP